MRRGGRAAAPAGATASPVRGAGVMLALAAVTTIPLCVCGLAEASLPMPWRRAPQLSGALMLAAAGVIRGGGEGRVRHFFVTDFRTATSHSAVH